MWTSEFSFLFRHYNASPGLFVVVFQNNPSNKCWINDEQKEAVFLCSWRVDNENNWQLQPKWPQWFSETSGYEILVKWKWYDSSAALRCESNTMMLCWRFSLCPCPCSSVLPWGDCWHITGRFYPGSLQRHPDLTLRTRGLTRPQRLCSHPACLGHHPPKKYGRSQMDPLQSSGRLQAQRVMI